MKPTPKPQIKTERQPPSEYKTLDDLFAQAAHYAEWNFRDHGHLKPALFIISADGPPAFMAWGKDFGDTESKDELVRVAQTFALAHGAIATVLALEVWTMLRSPEQRALEPHEMPSESPDRIEVVVLLGQTLTGQASKMLRIVRHDNGTFFNLVDAEGDLAGLNFAGRFANILPSKLAPETVRKVAHALLALKGFSVAGTAPRGKRKRTK